MRAAVVESFQRSEKGVEMPKVRKITPLPDEPDDDDDYVDRRRRNSYGYNPWDAGYPTSRPIRTDQGIKARSQRGGFGESWWAKRWINALDQFGWGNRLQRGKTYARQGQVLSIDFTGAKIKARVQGSRPRPYEVAIEMRALSDAQWEQVADTLAQQAIFAAKLLAGEMPQDIEQAFQAARVPLFPSSANDLSTSCSCPDYANPCKHIAAVYYLLGERFDADPFLIFQARGRTREQIIAALRARRAAAHPAEVAQPAAPIAPPAPALAEQIAGFYLTGDELDAIAAQIAAPQIEAALLRRLGPAPGGIDAELGALYRAIAQRAIVRALGDSEE